jgi:penicillin-binding protein 2
MVETTDAYAVGIVPNELTEGSKVVGGLARLFGLPASLLQAQIDAAPPDQYLPIGEVAEKELGARYRWLVGAEATRWTPFNARYYYGGGAAAHVTGYTIFIPPDQLAEYQAQGYAVDQRLGNAGLELWGEAVVRGTTGGQLTLLDAQGQPLKALIIKQPLYPPDVYTTLDFDLQKATQFALGDFTAAATVLNRDTGEVLALASSPTFDPNLFEPQNLNRQFSTGDASQGFLDRAAQDAYAAGSVFKIITFGAGLTSNLFTPQTQYTCNGYFDEIGPALILKDWQEGGHGVVTLQQGLSGSCNPYFWHVGLALHNFNPQWLPDTARAFGLGQTTGLTELQETPGIIPDPEWKRQTTGQAWETLDTLNMAIGQGDVLVTPLQMARLVAAVGNGGALLQPYLVQKVQAADATPSHTFTRTVVGQLPLDATQLAALQAAMHNVTQPPIGTARNRFRSLPSWLKVAGKTGTAEDPGVLGIQEPHAWFVGYTFANRPDKPDIAIAVWVGNRGQGSDYAAPIFRRILEAYYGLAYTRYPWEESVGVPAPEETPTPEAAPTAAP